MHFKIQPSLATIQSQIFPFHPTNEATVMKNHSGFNEQYITLCCPERVAEESTATEKFSVRNTASPPRGYTGLLKCTAELGCTQLGSKFPASSACKGPRS